MRLNILGLGLGAAFAFLIVSAGMSQPDAIHDMLLLREAAVARSQTGWLPNRGVRHAFLGLRAP